MLCHGRHPTIQLRWLPFSSPSWSFLFLLGPEKQIVGRLMFRDARPRSCASSLLTSECGVSFLQDSWRTPRPKGKDAMRQDLSLQTHPSYRKLNGELRQRRPEACSRSLPNSGTVLLGCMGHPACQASPGIAKHPPVAMYIGSG